MELSRVGAFVNFNSIQASRRDFLARLPDRGPAVLLEELSRTRQLLQCVVQRRSAVLGVSATLWRTPFVVTDPRERSGKIALG
jgi:hypothetical protein